MKVLVRVLRTAFVAQRLTAFAVAASTWVVSGPSRAQDDIGLELIPEQELAVVKAAVAALDEPDCRLDTATLAGQRLDRMALTISGIGALPEDLIDDFNGRNAQPRSLPANPTVGKEQGGVVSPLRERRRCVLSRPGFDKGRKQALMLVKMVYFYPEDIMNEGTFLLLSWKNGNWVLDRKEPAWQMRLGR